MTASTGTSPFALADTLVDELAALRPMQATFWGVAGHDHRWDDFSPEGIARAESLLRSWRARLATLPTQPDRRSRLAMHVLLDAIDLDLMGIEHGDAYVDLNSIASTFQNMRMVFDSMRTDTHEAWEHITTRLEGLGAACEGYRATLARGVELGKVVAVRQARAVIEQGRVHAGERSYFRTLPSAMKAAGVCDAALMRRLDVAVARACEAYGTLSNWIEHNYLAHARHEDGVGRERYVREMRRFLGSIPDPEETYAWGWSEVRRLRREMERVAHSLTHGGSLDEALRLVTTDPAYAAADRASFVELMQARQAQALEELDVVHFDVPEAIRRIDVRLAPPGGPLGAYYVPPSEDFSRPGTVWYSLHGDGPFPLWDEVSTAYHEGFPGHHLQCGIQVSLAAHLSRLHRIAYGYSGFAEGWALYAEQLMQELGYYERPEYELGMLANQMIRACRVVFDLGAHVGLAIPNDAPFHPGSRWNATLGVEFMMTFGGMSEPHAVSEVTRYLGWPAQAISYKVGHRAICSLRDEFLASGAGSIKAFHARVLACGNVGLDLLRAQVLSA